MEERLRDNAALQSVPSGASINPPNAQAAGPRRSTDVIDVFPPSPSRLLRTSSDAPASERRTSRPTHTPAEAKMVALQCPVLLGRLCPDGLHVKLQHSSRHV